MSRITQGCRPVSADHEITAYIVVTELDGNRPWTSCWRTRRLSGPAARGAGQGAHHAWLGLSRPADIPDDAAAPCRLPPRGSVRRRACGCATWMGLTRRAAASRSPEVPAVGMKLAFCERNMEAARADWVRVCAEIREELEPEEVTLEVASALSASEAEPNRRRMPRSRIAGAVYVSCSGRGGLHFGAPSAEMQIVRRALGDVPLVGIFAGGEIARHHLYGYTGVLDCVHRAGLTGAGCQNLRFRAAPPDRRNAPPSPPPTGRAARTKSRPRSGSARRR